MRLLRLIIRNNAVDSDPPEIYNGRVLLISLVACGGALLFGMDMGVIGGVLALDTFKSHYGFADKSGTELANLPSNIVSTLQAGAFAGALFSTWLANKIGRRMCLILCSLILFVGVALQAASSGYIQPLYVGSWDRLHAPRGTRGFLAGLYQLSIVTGLTLAFWINYGTLLHTSGSAQYIIPLSLQALPAVILVIGMFFANESPRYLAQKSPSKALQVLAKLRGLSVEHPYVVDELEGITRSLEEERILYASATSLSLFKEAFTGRANRRRSVLCIMLMAFTNLCGTNAVIYYSTIIFSSLVACVIFITFVTDTLGHRRRVGALLRWVQIRFDPPVSGQPIAAPGYVALVAIYIFAAVCQFGWGPVVWTYCPEIPAARLRALNMGMATASQCLFNFIVAKATPTMFATLGTNGFGTYFVYGAVFMVAYAWVFVPETKGLSLEDMNELFEQDSPRQKFVPSRTGRTISFDDGDKPKLDTLHVEEV
ncbi:general substrate transporter [Xylaria arbuscula]|nr:general substrate transporter [Xylaria arbuscula]